MKVISFCLYGNLPMFDIGALRNIKLAKEFYPEWQCWFYVPKGYSFIEELQYAGAKVIEQEPVEGHLPMLWRFLPLLDYNVDIMITRDTDARITRREANIVEYFIKHDPKTIQSLKDHEYHKFPPLMGGMLTFKNYAGSVVWDFKEDYDFFMKEGYKIPFEEYRNYGGNYKGADQIFLTKYAWPKVQHEVSFYSDLMENKIGDLTDKSMFIGNKFDEFDVPEYIRGY